MSSDKVHSSQKVVSDNIWRTKMLEQGLTQLGHALLLVSSRGEVQFASESAEMMLTKDCGLSIIDQKLVAEQEPDNIRLQNAIQTAIDSNCPQENSIGIYIHRTQFPRPFYLVLTRLLKPGEDRREGHSVFILIKDLNQNIERWATRLKASFDLSPREIECVVLLTERRDVDEIAEVMEISIETVRQYIKSMFKKMDVRKQHELVSLALEYRRNR
jgi:DNA-binding CsgD family transcriptional regulator